MSIVSGGSADSLRCFERPDLAEVLLLMIDYELGELLQAAPAQRLVARDVLPDACPIDGVAEEQDGPAAPLAHRC
jgi:hypothetical protein